MPLSITDMCLLWNQQNFFKEEKFGILFEIWGDYCSILSVSENGIFLMHVFYVLQWFKLNVSINLYIQEWILNCYVEVEPISK